MTKNIVLIGFMAAGKTTIGRLLAEKLARPFVDLDEVMTNHEGATPNTIFAEKGEAYFRTVEHHILEDTLVQSGQVIASGGGVIERADNHALLQQATVVLLATDFDTIVMRLVNDEQRPLVARLTVAQLYDLFQKRAPIYQQLADYEVAIDTHSPADIVDQIATYLHSER